MKVKLGDHLDFSNGNRFAGAIIERRYSGLRRQRTDRLCDPTQCPRPADRDRPRRILLRQCALLRFRRLGHRQRLRVPGEKPAETRYWYYALQTCGLNDHRAGSGQPLLNRAILRDVPVVGPSQRVNASAIAGAARRPRRQDRRQPTRDRSCREFDGRHRRTDQRLRAVVHAGEPLDGVTGCRRIRRRHSAFQPSGLR